MTDPPQADDAARRVLLCGWASLDDGEATVGDVATLEAMSSAFARADVLHDVAWSSNFSPRPGHPHAVASVDHVDPVVYTDVVFVCGPCAGRQITRLHMRFAHCRRIAVGVSVVDRHSDAVRGFDAVIARDGTDDPPRADLSFAVRGTDVPVVGLCLAPGQAEYGDRRRHDRAHALIVDWLGGIDCAVEHLDTRLDTATPARLRTVDHFDSRMARVDLVVTTRLHGLVRALCDGVPAVAVDPVRGGAKVTAQCAAVSWPALLQADDLSAARLTAWYRWCQTLGARRQVRQSAREGAVAAAAAIDAVVDRIRLSPSAPGG
ncbi:MAG: polysaccharide pyruvyl transferase family protein [Gordonia paraffinivorans]